MFPYFTTYKRIITVLLAVLLAIPCSLKKEWKQQFYAELHQNTNGDPVKISCTSFCSLQDNQNEKQELRQSEKKFAHHYSISKTAATDRADPAPPFHYAFFKEKIPTHIRHQQFLI